MPLWCGAIGCALYVLGACGHTVEVGVDEALSNGGSASGTGGAVSGSSGSGGNDGGAAGCVQTLCRGRPYQCGNCNDDDSDGLPDARDPECLGPCDDDELALSTGLPGTQTTACRQDCYFDGDKGPGNDDCLWSHACDERSVAPDYPPSGEARCVYEPTTTIMGFDCAAMMASQQQGCLDTCLPLAPNGCDCFGCCQLPGGTGEFLFVGLGGGADGCTLDRVDDPTACPPCTHVESCFNPCDECETCVGREAPVGCEPGSGCPAGQAACQTDEPCDYQEYCVTGCCVPAPEPT